MSSLQSINYESGDKDTFDSNVGNTGATPAESGKKAWSEEELKVNAQAINNFNANMPTPVKEPSTSSRGIYFGTFALTYDSPMWKKYRNARYTNWRRTHHPLLSASL